MKLPFYEFFPTDHIQKITPEQYWQTAGWLWKNRAVQAITSLVVEGGIPLLDAIHAQKAVKVDLDAAFPDPCLMLTGVFNAIDRPDLAAGWLTAYTNQDPQRVADYIAAVKTYLPGQTTPEKMDEITALIAIREFMPAASELRKIMSDIDYSRAIQAVHDVLKYYPPAVAGELPEKYKYKIPNPGERYSRTFKIFDSDPQIEQLIIDNFKPEDQEAVRELLWMYGSDAWEPEAERVQRVIIKRAEGDPMHVLRLVGYGKIDYRDVLIGE